MAAPRDYEFYTDPVKRYQAMLDNRSVRLLAGTMGRQLMTRSIRQLLSLCDDAFPFIKEERPDLECPLELALDALEYAAMDQTALFHKGEAVAEGEDLACLRIRRHRLPEVVRLVIGQYDLMNIDVGQRAGPSVLSLA